MVSSTGTFVSCKDYDDDIDNLQEQINKLATKEDMTSQIATLQAALTTAAKMQAMLLLKATAAETAAKLLVMLLLLQKPLQTRLLQMQRQKRSKLFKQKLRH